MSFKPILFILAGISLLSGCTYQGYSIKPLSAGLENSYTKLVDELQKTGAGGAILEKKCFAAPVLTADQATCAIQRNQVISALVIGSDEMCLDHRRSMYGKEAAWNITLGTMTNLFAGAASVVHTEKYRPILAALAVLANSERSLVNETVYKQILVTSVDKKIVEMRDHREQQIFASMALPVDKYPVQVALHEVISMHSSCSFIDGLQKALDEGTQGTSAQKIARLRATLRSLESEYAVVGNKAGVPAMAIATRIDAVTKALSAEEVR